MLRTYFLTRKETSPLHQLTCLIDKGYTPLNLT
jgi:hypothetical protein